ncbi:lectin ADEL-like [Aplysia californica]|uniref:Lectin ADEL-like n=1 Tax=Aplysia californica TaxID=6500 RepID=A0ABM1VTS3_APLCA|nr:lectin ADEL-like [Aplysia californica]
MKITKELSEGKCKKNKSFGYKGKKAWVKNDCRAVFKVCYKPKGEEDDDEEEGDDGEKGNCRTLKLESKNKEKDEKSLSKAKKIKSMKITKELSGGKCKKNKSFGYKGKKAWVKNDCRAVFKVCYKPKGDEGLFSLENWKTILLSTYQSYYFLVCLCRLPSLDIFVRFSIGVLLPRLLRLHSKSDSFMCHSGVSRTSPTD